MFAMPDAAELAELAASPNLRLSRKEAELYLPFILDAMRELGLEVEVKMPVDTLVVDHVARIPTEN